MINGLELDVGFGALWSSAWTVQKDGLFNLLLQVVCVDFTLELDWSEVVEISTKDFVVLMESQLAHFVCNIEEETTSHGDPGDDAYYSEALSSKELSSIFSSIEDSVLLVKKGNHEDSEDSTASMYLSGIKWIVYLESVHNSASGRVG